LGKLIDAVSDHGLLVIGSAAHRALASKFTGNTYEKVLHHLEAGMMVVN
jgi:nucleotide-binding universal stress UspA family protein